MQKFIGGIGCFWDEAKYEGIPGIISTECGYCGGKSPKVSYEQVCGGNTEHIEVVKVEFDSNIISYEEVTKLFPTTTNTVDSSALYFNLSTVDTIGSASEDVYVSNFPYLKIVPSISQK